MGGAVELEGANSRDKPHSYLRKSAKHGQKSVTVEKVEEESPSPTRPGFGNQAAPRPIANNGMNAN